MVRVIMCLVEYTLRVVLVVKYKGTLVYDLVFVSFLGQTIVVKVGKVFSKFEDFGEAWYYSLVIHNFYHLMWEKPVRDGQHSEFMGLLSQLSYGFLLCELKEGE